MEAVRNAITHRFIVQHSYLLGLHGVEKVVNAIEDVVDFVGEVEEIGTSDVSCWVKETVRRLRN